MTKPLVSAIVPVYNGERFLQEALQSVVDQDYRPLELIAVDDGSTDGSAEIIARFSEARSITQHHAGVAAARNRGVAAAQGDILAFLDQDDYWAVEKLRIQVDYLEQRPKVGMVLTQMRTFLEPGIGRPSWLSQRLLDEHAPGLLPGTFMVRRELFDRVGPFNVEFDTGSDSEWLLRARHLGEPLPVIPRVLLHRRVHSENQSGQATCVVELFQVVRQWITRHHRTHAEAP